MTALNKTVTHPNLTAGQVRRLMSQVPDSARVVLVDHLIEFATDEHSWGFQVMHGGSIESSGFAVCPELSPEGQLLEDVTADATRRIETWLEGFNLQEDRGGHFPSLMSARGVIVMHTQLAIEASGHRAVLYVIVPSWQQFKLSYGSFGACTGVGVRHASTGAYRDVRLGSAATWRLHQRRHAQTKREGEDEQ